MNYTIIENPWKDENTVVNYRGVMTDAKIAKLNNATKRPAIVKNWEDKMPQPVVSISTPAIKDYTPVFNSLGATVVNMAKESNVESAKKLRVAKIVSEKTSKCFDSMEKVDVVPAPAPVIEPPKVEEKPVVSPRIEPTIVPTYEEVHGRHERTDKVPVAEINEKVKNDTPVVSTPTPMITRAERNAMVNESKQEAKAGDMDLYNNLLHGSGQDEDVSVQLQGARNQLSIEKEENRKLVEKYDEAVKEYTKLKEDIETTKKQKEQQVKEELSITLRNIESLQKENLEKTSDLTSLQSEIAKLKAEKRAIAESFYEDSHSLGRAA